MGSRNWISQEFPVKEKLPPVHPTEIRTSISPSSTVELNTTSVVSQLRHQDNLKHLALESTFHLKTKELDEPVTKRLKNYTERDKRFDSIFRDFTQTKDLKS
uniref:Uncharacterized protein n=1 Tax=Timema monikensis TaxID=170555 RepID=A0A7R9HKM1_9NEOP|nr:unnamed protein product [Timema monikensis]